MRASKVPERVSKEPYVGIKVFGENGNPGLTLGKLDEVLNASLGFTTTGKIHNVLPFVIIDYAGGVTIYGSNRCLSPVALSPRSRQPSIGIHPR